MNVLVVLVCILLGIAFWLLDRRRRQAFEAEMAQRWRELHAAAEQQQKDRDDLDRCVMTARCERQAAISLLRKVLNQRTLARGMPIEDTAEAFAFLAHTPDDELPQVHEQVLKNQTNPFVAASIHGSINGR